MIEIEIIDPSRIIGMNLARTMRGGIKGISEPYAIEEAARIEERTPDATGSLSADEMYTSNTNPDEDEMAHFFTGTSNQLSAYGRVYSMYVEGPPMPIGTDPLNVGGLNGMWATPLYVQGYYGANMYGDVASDEDLSILEGWGVQGVQQGIDAIASGNGFR